MKYKIDLHMHSTASDGTQSPAKVVALAKERGLNLIALTDHDTIEGLEEALIVAKNYNIHFVAGIELNVIYRTNLYKNGEKTLTLDLLGYFIDYKNNNYFDKEFITTLEESRKYRIWRAKEVLNKTNSDLIIEGKQIITDQEWNNLVKNTQGSFSRVHIAELMIKKGLVENHNKAFQKYLIKNDVPKKELTLETGSALIRRNKGLVVLAHPHGKDQYTLRNFLPNIEDHGPILKSMLPYIDGLECYYWDHKKPQTDYYIKFARNSNLIITGGSDHHGGEKNRLGRQFVPEYVREFFS
ncbi:MAG: PHP domain-containing protein [Candidatus Woesearchaeota archaeon]